MSPGPPSAALLALPAVGTLGASAERVGVVLAALLAAVAVLAPARAELKRVRDPAMLGALVLTPVLLVADIWGSPQIRPLRHHPLIGVLALLVVAGTVALVTLALRRRPELFAPLVVAALPFRLPISSGSTTSNLLIPLYLVVAAGVLAHLLTREPARPSPPPIGRLEAALMGFVVLYAAQAAYSSDFTKALEQVVFFYVPFALLFALLRQVRWTPHLLATCLAVAVGLALVFVAIGFVEYSRRELLLNPKVIASNQVESYFRVNSLFFDPSIYGRFLALVMILLTGALLWWRRTRDIALAGAVLAALWGGLVLSFSQSSIGALLLGLATLAAWRFSMRATVAVSVAAVIFGAGLLLIAPRTLHFHLGSTRSTQNTTSGRYGLVKGGLALFADRPLQGFGPGSFAREYRRRQHASTEGAVSASHTIALTVAAEQGVVGLALYLVLLVAAFGRLFGRARGSPVRVAVGAAFAALVLHTLLYAAFLEDPLTWTLLGVGVALAAVPAQARGVPEGLSA